jgi:hypothetical protein
MINSENLLITLAEECSEIQQAVCKALRFGLENVSPVENKKNKLMIMDEYYQLCATIELLQKENILPTYGSAKILDIKENKKSKIKKYQTLSKRLGYLD